MLLTLQIFGILTMCTLMFVLIWGFIILRQISSQLKYRNYLWEKLNLHIYTLTQNICKEDPNKSTSDFNSKDC